MRSFAARFEMVPSTPDTVGAAVLAAGTGEAYDYPSNTDLVRISVASTELTTLGASYQYAAAFNPSSTAATWPTTDQAGTTASSGLNIIVTSAFPKIFQVPRNSTGFSLVSPIAGRVSMEYWKRGG